MARSVGGGSWMGCYCCRGSLLGSWLGFRLCGFPWLSEALVALFGSVGLLWLVGSPCGSLARSTLAEALVVGFPECSCKVVVTLLLPIKEGLYLELFREVKFCKTRQTLYPKQKLNPK